MNISTLIVSALSILKTKILSSNCNFFKFGIIKCGKDALRKAWSRYQYHTILEKHTWLLYVEMKYTHWMLEFMQLVLTNQCTLFQRNIDTPLKFVNDIDSRYPKTYFAKKQPSIVGIIFQTELQKLQKRNLEQNLVKQRPVI